jgi:outer membrane receptor protein involved in Fe transport
MKYFIVIFYFYASWCMAITIKGRVIDKSTGKPLPQANVQFLISKRGTTTDEQGHFIQSLPQVSSDTLYVQFIGYEPARMTISSDLPDSTFVIALTPGILKMEEIKVFASRTDSIPDLYRMDPAAIQMDWAELRAMPVTIQADLFRALRAIPGVSAANEAKPQFSVRGGDPDQNLVLLDGMTIYYPYHLFGLASAFAMDMIDKVYFSGGGFSAAYGDRLSAVLDIQSKTPDDRFVNRIDINLLGIDLTFGKQFDQRYSLLASGRLSFFELAKFVRVDVPYHYYDSYLKFSDTQLNYDVMFFQNQDAFSLDKTDSQYLISATSQDRTKFELTTRDNLSWTNRSIGVHWQYEKEPLAFDFELFHSQYANSALKEKSADFPEPLDSSFLTGKNRVVSDIYIYNEENASKITNRFSDWTFKVDATKQSFKALVRFGGQLARYSLNYGWDGPYEPNYDKIMLFFDYADIDQFAYRKNLFSFSGYIERESVWNPFLMRYGLRMTKWSAFKAPAIDPRIAIKWKNLKTTDITLGVGRTSQGLSSALEQGFITFLDLFLSPDAKPETANYAFLSASIVLPEDYKISSMLYVKSMHDLLTSTTPAPQFISSSGKAWGMELSYEGKLFGFHLLSHYTWSHSWRTNETGRYDTNFDHRHQFQLTGKRKLGKKIGFSFHFIAYTGQPYNPLEYHAIRPDYLVYDPFSPYENIFDHGSYSVHVPRGRIRYPPYHRLDISFFQEIQKKGFHFSPYLSVRNIYNRKNVLFYQDVIWSPKVVQGESGFIPRIERDAFSIGILPTLGIRMAF